MSILRAYADESGKASDAKCRCISMGAVIGEVHQWEDFDRRWRAMCSHHDIPYLHMKEVVGARHSGRGPFAKFRDVLALDRLMIDATDCIIQSELYCSAMSVWVVDLKNALKRHGLAADPYSFTLYVNVAALGTWALNTHPDDPSFEIILDRIEKGYSKIAQAKWLYQSDMFMAWRGWPSVTALKPKDQQGSKDICGLQVADLVAWSVRNELNNIQDWMRNIKPTLDVKDWTESLFDWLGRRISEQAVNYPERRAFFRPWARLMDNRRLKYYPYDEERLETHILQHRNMECEPGLKANSIQRVGRVCPLTP